MRRVIFALVSTVAGLVALLSFKTHPAETIALGEQFYYCIQGVDKPAERE